MGYRREDLIEEKERLEQEMKLDEKEKGIHDEKLKYIESYYGVKKEKRDSILTAIVEGIMAVLLSIPVLFNPARIPLLIAGIAYYGITALQIHDVVKKNKQLKQEYSDIYSLSKEQIFCEEKLLEKLSSDCFNHNRRLKERVEEITDMLLEEWDDEVFTDIKEAKELSLSNGILNEEINYSNNNSQENNKQLMKKM